MFSHSLPSKSWQKSPHKVPSCLPSNSLSSFTSATNPTKRCCLAEPGEEAGCDCWWYANMLVIPISRRLTPLAEPPSCHLIVIPGCKCWRAGALFALVGAAPQGWSVDWGLQADVMNNNVNLPKADRIVPHSDIRAIHRASLLFFPFQCKALGTCQSDQIKKLSIPLFPKHVSHILVAANNWNCSSFHFPHQ